MSAGLAMTPRMRTVPSIAGGCGRPAYVEVAHERGLALVGEERGGRYSSSHGTLSSAGAPPSDSVRRRPRPSPAAGCAGRVVAGGDVAGEQRRRRARRRAASASIVGGPRAADVAGRAAAVRAGCPADAEDRLLELVVGERQPERAAVLDAVGSDGRPS